MPDDAADSPLVPRKPDWLPDCAHSAMQQALYRAVAFGRDSRRIAEAVRDVARAHFPAAPMSMIEEAVACIVPDPQGLASHPLEWKGEPLREATAEEATSSISYAFRFDETGKPRRTGYEFQSTLAAKQLLLQLQLSGFVLMKRPSRKPHTAGG